MTLTDEAKDSLIRSVEYCLDESSQKASFEVGFRHAVESFLRSVVTNGPDAAARLLASAVKEGRYFAPNAKADAQRVLDTIHLDNTQEIGL